MNNFWARFRRNLLSDAGLSLITKTAGYIVGGALSVAFWQWLGAPLWAAAMGTLMIWSVDLVVEAVDKFGKGG